MFTYNIRLSEGNYEMRCNKNSRVNICYFPHLKGWIAAAMWDKYLYTDPMPTKKEAVIQAKIMIEEREKNKQ